MLTERYSPRSTKRYRQILYSLLLLSILIRLVMVIANPMYPNKGYLPGYNDEPLHLHYVKYVAENRTRPIFDRSLADMDTLTHQYIQSPLYYLLAAPVYQMGNTFSSNNGGMYSTRLLSVLFGVISIVLIFRLVNLLTGGEFKIAMGAAAAFCFAPNAVIFSSLVTNDALLILLSVVFIYFVVLSSQNNASNFHIFLASAFLAAAVWTKLSALSLFPLLWFCAPSSLPMKKKLLVLLQGIITCGVLTLPLFLWNGIHYGSPILSGVGPVHPKYMPEVALGVEGNAINHPVRAMKTLLRTAVIPFQELWGSNIEKTSSFLWLIWWGVLSLVGFVMLIWKFSRYGVLIMSLFLVGIAFLWYSSITFQVEFRLWIPAWVALSAMVGMGIGVLRVNYYIQGLLWIAPMLIAIITR